jgi:hypothetical protein
VLPTCTTVYTQTQYGSKEAQRHPVTIYLFGPAYLQPNLHTTYTLQAIQCSTSQRLLLRVAVQAMYFSLPSKQGVYVYARAAADQSMDTRRAHRSRHRAVYGLSTKVQSARVVMLKYDCTSYTMVLMINTRHTFDVTVCVPQYCRSDAGDDYQAALQ